jgi:hypothetical protein
MGEYSVPKMVVSCQTQEKQVRVEALNQFEEENLIEDSYLDGWPNLVLLRSRISKS